MRAGVPIKGAAEWLSGRRAPIHIAGMAQPVPTPPLSFEEYLRFEEAAAERHELVAGEVHALAGASRRHNTIVFNVRLALHEAARGTGCGVYAEQVRVRVAEDVVYYPDVVVACDPSEDGTHLVTRPCLVVEVTSPSTEAIDRREKLAFYRRVPTLRAYLVVDQARRRVERHWREGDGWRSTAVEGVGAVPVPCPGEGTVLDLDAMYAEG